jgi:hypothetical protein
MNAPAEFISVERMILHSARCIVKNHCLHRAELGGGLLFRVTPDLVQNHSLHRDKLGGGQRDSLQGEQI